MVVGCVRLVAWQHSTALAVWEILAMSSVCGGAVTRWPQEHGLANPKPLDYSTSGRAEQRLVQLARCALRRMSNMFWVGGSLLLVSDESLGLSRATVGSQGEAREVTWPSGPHCIVISQPLQLHRHSKSSNAVLHHSLTGSWVLLLF